MIYDTIVIGSGAAGLSSAIYAGRYLMKTLVVKGEFGGETAKAGTIWNYPGTPQVDGFKLMADMEKQAKENGAEFVTGEVEEIKNDNGCFKLKIKDKEYQANTVVFAQGSKRRRLGLPNETELTSKGIHYCVTCDGPLYSGKTIAMVGGGDASVKGINQVAQYVNKIYFLVMLDHLDAEPVNEKEMKELGDKVEILYETQIKEIVGTEKLEKVILDNGKELNIDGLFIEIGAIPDISLASSIGVELDDQGYIKVDNMMKSNIPGVFAAGDAVNHFGAFKQTITAAALGAVAATSAYNYKKSKGNLCEVHWKPHD